MRNKFDYFDNDQKNKVHVEVCFVSVINFNHKKKYLLKKQTLRIVEHSSIMVFSSNLISSLRALKPKFIDPVTMKKVVRVPGVIYTIYLSVAIV